MSASQLTERARVVAHFGTLYETCVHPCTRDALAAVAVRCLVLRCARHLGVLTPRDLGVSAEVYARAVLDLEQCAPGAVLEISGRGVRL